MAENDDLARAIAELEHTYDYWTKRIDSEDQLIDHRMQWLLVSQGLIFTAIGFGGTTSITTTEGISTTISAVVRVIPWVGMTTAAFQWVSIIAAIVTSHWAKKRLASYYREWEKRVEHDFKEIPTRIPTLGRPLAFSVRYPSFPQTQRSRFTFYTGFAGPVLVAPVFIAAWIYVAVLSL